jgi:hypothetical protein
MRQKALPNATFLPNIILSGGGSNIGASMRQVSDTVHSLILLTGCASRRLMMLGHSTFAAQELWV